MVAPSDYALKSVSVHESGSTYEGKTLDHKYVTAKMSATGVPLHKNSRGDDGYWIGIGVPEVFDTANNGLYTFTYGYGTHAKPLSSSDANTAADCVIGANGETVSSPYTSAKFSTIYKGNPADGQGFENYNKGIYINVYDASTAKKLVAVYDIDTSDVTLGYKVTAEDSYSNVSNVTVKREGSRYNAENTALNATGAAGDKMDVTVTAADGFTATGITYSYTDAEGESATQTVAEKDAKGNFVITMPASDVAITAVATEHTITLGTVGANGKVTKIPASAAKDATVTVETAPDAGYALESITATGVDGNAITYFGNNASFAMPDSSVTVTATFEEATTYYGDDLTVTVTNKTWGAGKTATDLLPRLRVTTPNSTGGTEALALVTASSQDGYMFDLTTIADKDGKAVNPTDEIDAGSYSVFIVGTGKYATSGGDAVGQKVSYSVEQLDISATGVDTVITPYTSTDTSNYSTYTGNAIRVSFKTVTVNNAPLEADVDYLLAPSTVENAGAQSITLTGKGNYKGSKTATFEVGRAEFAKTVAGKDTAAGQPATLYVDGFTPDADQASTTQKTGKLASQEFGGATDPVPAGSVKFGKKTLVRDEDYTVAYYEYVDADENPSTPKTVSETAMESFPTEIGKYQVVISSKGTKFDLASTKAQKVVAEYSITALGLSKFAETVEVGTGAYQGGTAGATLDPDSVKFYDESGEEVDLAGKWDPEKTQFEVWTPAMEKELLGATAYEIKYGKGKDYVNEEGVKASTDNLKALTPGDYQIRFYGKDDTEYAGEGYVAGKFTVAAAVVAQGDAVGDIVVNTAKVAYDGTEIDEAKVKAAAATNAYDKKTDCAVVEIIEKITPSTTVGGKATQKRAGIASADYSIAIYKDGEKQDSAKAAGAYDLVITFKGGFAGSKQIEAKGALVIEQQDISGLVVAGPAADGKFGVSFDDATYTGNGLTVKPKFADKADGTKAAFTDKDYALTFAEKSASAVVSGGKPLTVGEYYVYVNGAGNYKGTVAGDIVLNVVPLELSADTAVIQFRQDDGTYASYYSEEWTADSKESKPALRVVTADTANTKEPVIIPAADYSISYANNTSQGAATATVKGTGTSVSGEISSTFTLSSNTFEKDGVTLELAKGNVTYNGAQQLPVVTVRSAAGSELAGTTYYRVVYKQDGIVLDETEADAKTGELKQLVDAGTYTVEVIGGSNGYYAGKLTATYTIDPVALTQADVYDAKTNPKGKVQVVAAERTYNGEAQEAISQGSVTYNANGIKSEGNTELSQKTATSKKWDYSVENAKNTNAGDYTATITFNGNYSGTVAKDYTVKPLDISLGANGFALYTNAAGHYQTLATYDVDFTGKAQEPAVTLYRNGSIVEDESLNIVVNTYANNTKAGSATATSGPKVTVIADGNYTGKIEQGFTINAVDITSKRVELTWNDEELFATGEPIVPKGTAVYTTPENVYTLVYGEDYEVAKVEGDNVNAGGKATATVVGKGNFGAGVGYFTQDFTVKENTRQDQAITVGAGTTVTKAAGSGAFNLNAKTTGDSTLEYASSDPAVATVDAYGNVTPVSQGAATITVTAPATMKFNAASATVELTVTAAEQQKAQTITASDVTVAAGKTAPINAKASGNGILTYATSNPAVATVSATGVVTGVKAGTAIVTIEAGATASFAAATKAIVVTVTAAPAPTPSKLANPVKVKVVKKSYKAKAGKKTVLKAKKVFKVTNNKGGKVTYKKANKAGGKKITVSKKGKVVVKKGLKAGPYKVKVKATAKAKGNYKKAVKTVTVKVKVAKAKK